MEANLQTRLWEWSQMRDQLKQLTAQEKDLRAELFKEIFPDAKEGAVNMDLPAGWKVRGNNKITRTLLKKELAGADEEVVKKLSDLGVIVHKPELGLSAYRKLDGDLLRTAEQFIEIKPGMPELELVPPKEAT